MSTLLQDARKRLQVQGGRMTAQRKLILETLESMSGHPTAEDLFGVVSQRDACLNISTVYRTLRWLEQEGLVSARRFDEDHRQERFDPALPIEHHHFLCTECKKVIEFNEPMDETIKKRFEVKYRTRVESTSIMLYGICKACLDKMSGSKGCEG